jgi:hypothetical protein
MLKKITALLLGMMMIIYACNKDEDPVPPTVSLKSGNDYTPDGAVIAVGGPLKFGIVVSAGNANITNLVVKKIMPDNSEKIVLDSGLNSTGFSIDRIFYQSVEEQAQWTVQVMDKNRLFATAAITINKDPNSSWGGIYDYGLITMGYQDNTTYGQFLVPSTGQVFTSDSAGINQSMIDLVTYYFVDENLPSPTFSSSGELGGGITTYYPQLAQWSTLRYTKWDISVDGNPIPVSSFDACYNDSLLILSYNDVWGKRKFKWADAGKVIPFMTASGKKGLVKVLNADHDPAGKIEFALKIQQ